MPTRSIAGNHAPGLPDFFASSLWSHHSRPASDSPGSPGRSSRQKAWVSAKTGRGLESLISLVKSTAGVSTGHEGSFSARTRHLDALKRTLGHIDAGRGQFEEYNAPEILAEELRLAQKTLGEITGEYLPDDLLGAIFSSFCIGK